MIEFKRGDLLAEDVVALVNPVNCVGVMGRGLSLQFKKAFPENFTAYAAACRRGRVKPGGMFVHATGRLVNPRYIINFPTKRHWRDGSRMADIDAGLAALARTIRERDIQSIAIPPLGCGLGGLSWREVRPRLEHAMRDAGDVRVVVLGPDQPPQARQVAGLRSRP